MGHQSIAKHSDPLSWVANVSQNTVIPLHIFEERYKQMIDDSVSSHNLICMTLMQDDMKDDDLAISKIGCVGRIISNEEGEEGKKNIILYGISSIHIDEITYSKPYRQAKINIRRLNIRRRGVISHGKPL